MIFYLFAKLFAPFLSTCKHERLLYNTNISKLKYGHYTYIRLIATVKLFWKSEGRSRPQTAVLSKKCLIRSRTWNRTRLLCIFIICRKQRRIKSYFMLSVLSFFLIAPSLKWNWFRTRYFSKVHFSSDSLHKPSSEDVNIQSKVACFYLPR